MPSNTEDERAARAREITNAYNQTYRLKNIEAKRAYERAYYAKNKDKLLERKKNQRPTDPEIIAARAAYMKEYAARNREAVLEHKRRYRENNRVKLRAASYRYLRDETGEITPRHKERHRQNVKKRSMDLETMAGRSRPEICEACGGPPDKGKSLHFDHCHALGHFRGWICRECNLILGYAKDEPARLLKLIAYIKRTKIGTVPQFNLPGV